jgi:hypothetical protein
MLALFFYTGCIYTLYLYTALCVELWVIFIYYSAHFILYRLGVSNFELGAEKPFFFQSFTAVLNANRPDSIRSYHLTYCYRLAFLDSENSTFSPYPHIHHFLLSRHGFTEKHLQ